MDGVRYLIHNHARHAQLHRSRTERSTGGSVADRIFSVWYSSASSPGVPTSRSSSAYSPLKDLKEAQKGALYCAFLKILGFMFLALPGVIAYAIFNIEGTQVPP